MSYDLSLAAGKGKKIDKKSFSAYFKARPRYELGNGQAVYQNEETGVYFIFDEPQDGMVMFNLNYFRPHTFALEAAIELEALAKTFGATVADPQGEMADDGPFVKEGFLRGWNHGNRFAYKSMLEVEDGPVHAWPRKRIREVWEWNYARALEREKDEEELEGQLFAPVIFAVDLNGEAKSVGIWPPECTILLPEVDAVMLPVAQTGPQAEELALVMWKELAPLVKAYQEKGPGITRYRLEFEDWPPDLATFLNKKRKPAGELNGIGMDQVLDRELVEEARG